MGESPTEEGWVLDSGTTHHMCGRRSLFKKLESIPEMEPVILGNGNQLSVEGVGTVSLSTDIDTELLLPVVLYVPKLTRNLMSVYFLLEDGLDISFNHRTFKCDILRDSIVLISIEINHSLWILSGGLSNFMCGAFVAVTPDLLHLRFNHLNMSDIQKIVDNGMVTGWK
jgi:hypothetical protein